MPISPDPPSAQNSSSSPGIISARQSLLIQETQPLDGEIGLNGVKRVGMLVEQGREAARSHDRDVTANLALQSLDQALDHCDIAPINPDQHLLFSRPPDHA